MPIEDSDQPAHPRSLIRVFDRSFMCSQWSNDHSVGYLDCGQTVWMLEFSHKPTCTLFDSGHLRVLIQRTTKVKLLCKRNAVANFRGKQKKASNIFWVCGKSHSQTTCMNNDIWLRKIVPFSLRVTTYTCTLNTISISV